MARLAITSLAFILLWVPEPVWKTTSGNSSSRTPAITSSAAWTMAATWASVSPSRPSSALAWAAAVLRMPRARMIGRPQTKESRPMSKLARLRCVCAPQ